MTYHNGAPLHSRTAQHLPPHQGHISPSSSSTTTRRSIFPPKRCAIL
eukprot:CAMPEP_0196818058 /NCGR_PEP_ID=MMETSP1362-20130617/63834_1 /TAXON_ID=163516 /ORGANISM="Leptocylindrus danicus, Strain CCMP1856" /LENGTH=46 /DNA_ID= /DNA_START= /DNA_END= /DNA_ORIENTATION=